MCCNYSRVRKCDWKKEKILKTHMSRSRSFFFFLHGLFVVLFVFFTNLHGGEKKKWVQWASHQSYSSRTPLKNCTKKIERKAEKWLTCSPPLYSLTLSPCSLSLFFLSCPLWVQRLGANELRTTSPLSTHLNVSTIVSFSFISVFSHLASHLCSPLHLSYPISTHLPIQCPPVYPILSLPHPLSQPISSMFSHPPHSFPCPPAHSIPSCLISSIISVLPSHVFQPKQSYLLLPISYSHFIHTLVTSDWWTSRRQACSCINSMG